ncbi:hypothetical protein [Leifsonia sp. 21MFCrub1.1]|uniref:hypothetical protein n=1 Tax=Leifsonia sp. 21MFCrub1.1 TaxID=1798223 RepID=UPI0008928662|nr:hypothetical protein [Leifsonia sp. 21MFCrub1.1]SEB10278.1 hypothetical protein SAMN04515680_3277 [Leifsonia sp. 21MFCrub1.1]
MSALNEALVTAHARVITVLTVNNPSPDFSGPGVGALQSIANVVFAIVLTLGVIGGLIAAGFIVVGHISSNGRVQKMGIVGVVSCVAGVAVAAGIAGLINWGQSLKVA